VVALHAVAISRRELDTARLMDYGRMNIQGNHGALEQLASYPCPNIFSISGHRVTEASSASNGRRGVIGPRVVAIRGLATKTYITNLPSGFLTFYSPSLTALLDRPRGGTLAPAGRWLCGRNSIVDEREDKRTNLIRSQFCNTQSINSVYKTTGCFKYTGNLFVCYTHKH
jgi:hypothetical protein